MIEKIMEEIGKLYVDKTGYGYECNLKEYSEVLCGNCCECIKSACKVIIRKHMNDKSETYAFDFANTEAFDCPCGRHYVHLAIPPKLEFCEKCKEKVRNNRTDICPKCRKKLYEYEKKYNCVVDIGMNGCDGARGEKYILPHGERRIN